MRDLASMIAEENQLIGEERGTIIGEERGIIIGEKRGFVKGEDSKSREISLKLYSENKSIEYIAGLVGTSISQVKEWIIQSNDSKSNVLN